MRNYRFDYTMTVFGRSRSGVKKIKAYAWNDAANRLRKHLSAKWAESPFITINNAEVDGGLINPDLLPEINKIVATK